MLLLLLTMASAAVLVATAASSQAQDREQSGAARVDVLHVEGPITPVVASYLARGLADAQSEGVDLIVIQLDTPGGSVQVTEELMKDMAASDVPIAVWVGPSGAMAGSVGTFITLAAHVAAMAPGTTIGAASPIGPQGGELPETIKSKLQNMLVTMVRSLTKRRGPQAQDWAESTVTHAVADDAESARQLDVIDLIVRDIPDLLRAISSPFAFRMNDKAVTLEVANAIVRDVEMSAAEKILHKIASPDLAYILLALGLLGIVFEFSSPGFGFAGVVGAICLLFGVYAMGVLPANYTGVAMIALAFALFVADAKLGTSGLLAMGGVVAMVAGGMLLFDSPIYAVSQPVLWTTALSCGAFFAFAAGAVFRSQRRRPTTGREGLVGARGVVRTPLTPEGLVVVQGETWRATADDGPFDAGASVVVSAVEGLRVRVRAAGVHTTDEHATDSAESET